MKRTLLILCALFVCLVPLSAQTITLNQSSYPGTVFGTDSVSISYGSQGVPVNFGGFGDGAIYDLSMLHYTVVDTPYILHSTPPTPYTYEDFHHHIVSGPLYFHTYGLYIIDSNSFREDGEILYRQGFSISDLPGALATDSIIFPSQTDLYTSPLVKIHFPATYGDIWSSSYTSDINFLVNYTSIYNQAPGLYRSIITEHDSLIGAGNMIVLDANGDSSGQMPVLEDRVYYQQIDSFFINDTAASPLLLLAFGLVQGKVTNSYEYKFYRPMEVTPLADVTYNDNSFSSAAVNNIVVHTQRTTPLAVAQVNTAKNISVYPNPVTRHTVFIEANGSWTYELINTEGQKIATSTLPATSTSTQISLPSGIATGVYYLRLNNNGKQTFVKTLSILN